MNEALHPASIKSRKVLTLVAINRTIVAFSVFTLVTSLILFGAALVESYRDLPVALPSLMIGFWLILTCILALIGVMKANHTLMLISAIGKYK